MEWALVHVVSTAEAESGLYHDEFGRSIFKELYESPMCCNDCAFDLVCLQLTGTFTLLFLFLLLFLFFIYKD